MSGGVSGEERWKTWPVEVDQNQHNTGVEETAR